MPNIAVITARKGNFFIDDIAANISEGLARNGLNVIRARIEKESDIPNGVIPLLVAPQEFLYLVEQDTGRLLQSDFVAVATEQPGTPWLRDSLKILARARLVYDLNDTSVESLKKEGIDAQRLILGYSEKNDYSGQADKRFDVLFYGSVTPRRSRMLEKIVETHPALQTNFIVKDVDFAITSEAVAAGEHGMTQGRERGKLIAASRICLNIHHQDYPYFPQARMLLEYVSSGAFVISERCADSHPLVPGEHFIQGDYEELPALIGAYLGNPDATRIADRAHAFFRSECPVVRTYARLSKDIQELKPFMNGRPASGRGKRPNEEMGLMRKAFLVLKREGIRSFIRGALRYGRRRQ